jgi:hypothetical protein
MVLVAREVMFCKGARCASVMNVTLFQVIPILVMDLLLKNV